MRIGMILEVPFPPHPRVEKEMRALTAAGHEVHLLCYGTGRESAAERLDGLGWAHRVFFPTQMRPFRLLRGCHSLYNRFWRPHIRRFVARVRPGAMHVHDLTLAEAAYRAARESGAALVLDFHENFPAFIAWAAKGYGPLVRRAADVAGYGRAEAKAVARADRLIVVDPSNAERLARRYGVPAAKMTVVSNTPELGALLPPIEEARKKRPEPRGRLTVLYMGGLDYMRGLHTVVAALAHRREELSGLDFVVVGAGPYLGALRGQARELGLEGRVRFEGWQPYGRLAAYLAAADLGAVPHVRDELTDTTIPNKLFEYMAAGLPVVASDCAPIARVVESSGCGAVFRSGDVASCAGVLAGLAADAGLRTRLGAAGRRAAEEVYNWDVDAANLRGLYRGLFESDRGSTSR